MAEVNNNEEKLPTEKCYCQKKIVVLEKHIKEFKSELARQKHEIEVIKKVLKSK
jgi:hypothetical protein